MWVSSLTRFIPEQVFDQGNEPIDMDALIGRECYGGLDLSSTTDMTSFVLQLIVLSYYVPTAVESIELWEIVRQ